MLNILYLLQNKAILSVDNISIQEFFECNGNKKIDLYTKLNFHMRKIFLWGILGVIATNLCTNWIYHIKVCHDISKAQIFLLSKLSKSEPKFQL